MLNRLITAASAHHPQPEARAIAMAVLEDVLGLSRTAIYMGRFANADAADAERIEAIAQKLEAGIPMQYAVGFANFGGRRFDVTLDTLIPRPETEQLVTLGVQYVRDRGIERPRILDAGTGTGCIAVSIACELPEAEVSAWDISQGALEVARHNSEKLGANVRFELQDIMTFRHDHEGHIDQTSPTTYDLIISNPPYICQQERQDMAAHVLDYEPASALFVPDADPLCFYHALLGVAEVRLAQGGAIMMECNTAYVADVAACFAQSGFETQRLNDCFDRPRFVVAQSSGTISSTLAPSYHY